MGVDAGRKGGGDGLTARSALDQRCPMCRAQVAPTARFCARCGHRIGGAADATRADRRHVTALFADVIDSVGIGRRLDPEALTSLLQEVHALMANSIKRHGGHVAGFAGDAVLGIFGVPVIHEDDALRALRAASEMREAVGRLAERATVDWQELVQVHIGVNSGEAAVQIDERGESLVIGDAVNLAARLQQAAPPGAIYVGASTRDLAERGARFEQLPAFDVKGYDVPVGAYRLDRVERRSRPREFGAPLVGRKVELEALQSALTRCVEGAAWQAVCVVGEPGVGKSRLVAEFLANTPGAVRSVVGHCLPYGSGITYWPLRELFADLCEMDVDAAPAALGAAIGGLVADDGPATHAARRLGGHLGVTPGAREDIASATRQVLASLARRAPLVLVLEDLQWAEAALFDLLDHLADQLREVPVLLVAVARPELVDEYSPWLDRVRAELVRVEPLDTAGTREMVAGLRPEPGTSAMFERVRAASGGNPLFIEEIVRASLRDPDGAGIPPTVQALIADRIDQLPPEVRVALTTASVIGERFSTTYLDTLCGPDRRLDAALKDLIRRGLLRGELGDVEGGHLAFHHLIVRDVAYAALPKEQRARLHEAFAGCLENSDAAAGPEHAALAGHHLEQAYHLVRELRPGDAGADALAERAYERLASAGRSALLREDLGAAAALLARADALLDSGDPRRIELLLDRFSAAGEDRVADGLCEEAEALAQRVDDPAGAANAEIVLMRAREVRRFGTVASEESRLRLPALVRVLEEHGHLRGLARAAELEGDSTASTGAVEAAISAYRRSLAYAIEAGDRLLIKHAAAGLAHLLCYSNSPVDVAAAEVGAMLHHSDEVGFRQRISAATAVLSARAGDGAASAHMAEALEAIEAIGRPLIRWWCAMEYFHPIERLLGNAAASEHYLREAARFFDEEGMEGWARSARRSLAGLLCEFGRFQEAMDILPPPEGARLSGEGMAIQAAIEARLGDVNQALEMSGTAVETLRTQDDVQALMSGMAHRADVLAFAGDVAGAREVLEELLAIQEARHAEGEARMTRRALGQLRPGGVSLLAGLGGVRDSNDAHGGG